MTTVLITCLLSGLCCCNFNGLIKYPILLGTGHWLPQSEPIVRSVYWIAGVYGLAEHASGNRGPPTGWGGGSLEAPPEKTKQHSFRLIFPLQGGLQTALAGLGCGCGHRHRKQTRTLTRTLTRNLRVHATCGDDVCVFFTLTPTV